MNLIEEIKKLLTGEVMSKLSGLIGESEAKTSATVGAAVPAMLAGVSKLASNESGLSKLASALGGIDTGALSNPAQMLSGGGLMEKGSQMLGGLFGNNILGSLGGVLSKFTGVGSGGIGKLLGLLAPMVLGGLAKSWTSSGGGAKGLSTLLESQKSNIQAAMPSGFNLGDAFGSVSASAPAAPASGGGFAKLIPIIIGLLALGGVGWYVLDQMGTDKKEPTAGIPLKKPIVPEVAVPTVDPEVASSTETFTKFFGGIGETLGGVKDAATADAALPKLKEMATQADGFKGMLDKLPAVGKVGIVAMLKEKLVGLKEMVTKLLALPGVGDKLKPVIDPLMAKLTGLGA